MHVSDSNPTHQTTTNIINTGVIVHDETPEQKYPSWLRHVWAYLMHHILRGDEPRIWERHNSAREVYYRCYDPRTGQSISCGSEAEVRIWLEQLPF
jgi:hypothetical protein